MGAQERSIRLAQEQPFRIGSICVDPPTRRLTSGTRSRRLEPRVMQVLILLAERSGAVVSREEMIERCWGGRIVGVNAIDRAISLIRQAATELDGTSVTIETIPKVGYRLDGEIARTLSAGALDPAQSARRRGGLTRRQLVAGGIGVTAAAFAGIGFWLGGQGQAVPEEALALYRKAREAQAYGTIEGSQQASAFLKEAVRIDPAFAEAWGALALVYFAWAQLVSRPESDRLSASSRSAASRALELDAGNSDGLAALLLLRPRFRNWTALERDSRDFLRDMPEQTQVRWLLASLLCDVGRWRDAVEQLRIAAANDPYRPVIQYLLAMSLWSSGRLEEAEAEIERAVRRWPGQGGVWILQFWFYAYTGRPEAALAFAQSGPNSPVQVPEPVMEIGSTTVRALASRDPAEIRTAVDLNLRRLSTTALDFPMVFQNVAALGRLDLVHSLAEGYYLGRGPWAATGSARADRLTRYLFQPALGPFRQTPVFEPLVREIGLIAYWARSVAPDFRR